MQFLSDILRLTHLKGEKKPKKRGGNRLKKHPDVSADVLICQALEVQTPGSALQPLWGPFFAYSYYSPDDVGRGLLRITNPDPWGGSPDLSGSTPWPTPRANSAVSTQHPDDRAIAESQSLPNFYGPGSTTVSSNTLAVQGPAELSCPLSETVSRLPEVNPLQANPPSCFQDHGTVSWLYLNASTETVSPGPSKSSQAEASGMPTKRRVKPFNPVTQEDCPPKANPAMHGPGSRYFQYSQPETFRASSERLAQEISAEAAVPKHPTGTLQHSRPPKRLPHPPSVPERVVVYAQVKPVLRHQQRPAATDPNTSGDGVNPFGHYVDREELFLHHPPTPLEHLSEPTAARRESNKERLKQRTRHALEALTSPSPTPSPQARPTTHHRRRSLEDLSSFINRPRRSSAGSATRWDDHAVTEGLHEAVPSRWPSFSNFRLTLSGATNRAKATAATAATAAGYFTSRHNKRQTFVQRNLTDLLKKGLEMEKAARYLGEALDDWGTFEIDFSKIGVEE